MINHTIIFSKGAPGSSRSIDEAIFIMKFDDIAQIMNKLDPNVSWEVSDSGFDESCFYVKASRGTTEIHLRAKKHRFATVKGIIKITLAIYRFLKAKEEWDAKTADWRERKAQKKKKR